MGRFSSHLPTAPSPTTTHFRELSGCCIFVRSPRATNETPTHQFILPRSASLPASACGGVVTRYSQGKRRSIQSSLISPRQSPTLRPKQSKASRVAGEPHTDRPTERPPSIPVLCIAPSSFLHGAVHTTLDVIEVRGRRRRGGRQGGEGSLKRSAAIRTDERTDR